MFRLIIEHSDIASRWDNIETILSNIPVSNLFHMLPRTEYTLNLQSVFMNSYKYAFSLNGCVDYEKINNKFEECCNHFFEYNENNKRKLALNILKNV